MKKCPNFQRFGYRCFDTRRELTDTYVELLRDLRPSVRRAWPVPSTRRPPTSRPKSGPSAGESCYNDGEIPPSMPAHGPDCYRDASRPLLPGSSSAINNNGDDRFFYTILPKNMTNRVKIFINGKWIL